MPIDSDMFKDKLKAFTKPWLLAWGIMPLLLLAALLPALLLGWLHLSGVGKPPTLLDTIIQNGKLVVATRYSPTTYFHGPDGPSGPEYDLVTAFADSIGVKAEFVIPENLDNILTLIEKGEADIAAAGLTVLPDRQERVSFGPSYLSVSQLLIGHEDKKPIKRLEDVRKGVLQVIEGTSHEAQLEALKESGRLKLPWKTSDELDTEKLLYLVHEKVIDYTVVDSNEYNFFESYFPHITSVYELGQAEPLAWAMQKRKDDSLMLAVKGFFNKMKKSGQLKALNQHYYQHIDKLTELDTDKFWERVENRLPKYDSLFKKTADAFGRDWHLLAAIGYQESQWDPQAVSPTGVKGLMMLTNATAKQVKIKDRTDPAQSILGAARYLDWLEEQLPETLREEDKIWFTLAAYNVGMGHLEDARVLTQRAKRNPNRWLDVRDHLPLLGRKRWYSKVRHGYARGREPVIYVDNIRNYYDLLVWHTNSNGKNGTPLLPESGPANKQVNAKHSESAEAPQSSPSSASLSIDK